ncbi:hypothetical protein IFO70_31630 [Phormidium tenue FACHB-886]|nr:hypothetical protein [Phormidium tenue FACHB-886]
MDTELLNKFPWLALSLLGIAYLLLGWYLTAHHIFWLVSTFILMTTLTIAWKSNPMLESLVSLLKQQLFTVLGITSISSLVVVLTLVNPILLSLVVLPLLTLLYALIEMRAAELKQMDIFLWSTIITGVGLGLGEVIDLFVVPSMRY